MKSIICCAQSGLRSERQEVTWLKATHIAKKIREL
jgi:hypothetical protein